MNKKKLCATLTLSAFAASLLPGMAFADEKTSATVSMPFEAHGYATMTYTADTGETFEENFVKTWLSAGDTAVLTLNGNSFTAGTDYTYKFLPGDDPGFTFEFLLNDKHFLPNKIYNLTITNTDGKNASGEVVADTTKSVTFEFQADDGRSYATVADPDSISLSISNLTGKKPGSTPTTADYTKGVELFKIKESEASYVRKVASSELVDIDCGYSADNTTLTIANATQLEIGYYGIAEADTNDVTDVFVFTADHKAAIANAVKVAEEAVTTAKKAIADAVKTIPLTSSTSTYLNDLSATIDNIDTITVKEVSSNLKGIVLTDIQRNGEIDLGNADSASGEVTFEFTINGVPYKLTTPVTITKVSSINDVVAAYVEKYLTDYDATAKTATLTVKAGDTINMGSFNYNADGTVKTGTIALSRNGNATLADYIDIETGAVTNDTSEDYTTPENKPMIISFKGPDKAVLETINVTVTVKAGEATTPSDFDPEKVTTDDLANTDYTKEQLLEVKEVAETKVETTEVTLAEVDKTASKEIIEKGAYLDLTNLDDVLKLIDIYLASGYEDAFNAHNDAVELLEAVNAKLAE